MSRISPDANRRQPLFAAIAALGVSAFLTQIVLMRELLGVFAGNELIFGIVLGNWMLLTGAGAAAGRWLGRLRSPLAALAVGQVLIALLPALSVVALRTLRDVVFLRGAEIGVTDTVLACAAVMGPYCLTMGGLLTLACIAASDGDQPEGIGWAYCCDCLGTVAGSLAFSLVLVHWLGHFGMLYAAAVLNLVAALWLTAVERRWVACGLTAVVAAAAVVVAAVCDLDGLSLGRQHAGQQIVYRGHSPYGSLVVAESAGQLSFIENGVPLFSTGQVERAEETVHYAMAQRPDARRVLLISGGVSGTAREVVRYPAAEVDYVELDPLVLDVADELLPDALDHPRIHVIRGDGRRHVRQTAARYDVVIVDVPEPSTSQLNRYYTREFFAEVRGALRPQGVLCVSLSTYANYVSRELAALLGIAVQTLRTSFDHVLMLPGGRVFLLASDGPLTAEVAAPMAAAGVAPRLLTESYLRHTFARDRMADLQRAVDESAPVNADFNPTLYFHCLRYWLSQFRVRYGLLLGGLAVLLGGYLLLARPVPLAVFATGFAGAALEVVLLLAVQILFGSVYYQVGLTVGAFMAGLGGGSLWASRTLPRRNRRDLALLTAGVAAFAAALPSALGGLGRLAFALPDAALQTLVLLLTCVLGGLVGAVFPLAGKLDFRAVAGTAAQLFWADYLGAALGALLVSALLIPVLGVAAVCWLAAGANLLAAVIVARSKR